MVDMAYPKLRRFARGPGPMVLLVLLLLTTLKLMSDATQNSARFGDLYLVLLILNSLGLVTLGALIVGNFVNLLDGKLDNIGSARVACIGPVTALTAQKLGIEVDIIAQTSSIYGLVTAIKNYYHQEI